MLLGPADLSRGPCLALCQQLGPSPLGPRRSPRPSPHKAGSTAVPTERCWPGGVTTTGHSQPGSRPGPRPLALRTGRALLRAPGSRPAHPSPSSPRRYYKETSGLMLDVGGYMKALEVPARALLALGSFWRKWPPSWGFTRAPLRCRLCLPLPPSAPALSPRPCADRWPSQRARCRPLLGSVCGDHLHSPPWAPAAWCPDWTPFRPPDPPTPHSEGQAQAQLPASSDQGLARCPGLDSGPGQLLSLPAPHWDTGPACPHPWGRDRRDVGPWTHPGGAMTSRVGRGGGEAGI